MCFKGSIMAIMYININCILGNHWGLGVGRRL